MAVGVQPLADKMDEAMAAESQLYGSAIIITQVDAEQHTRASRLTPTAVRSVVLSSSSRSLSIRRIQNTPSSAS